MRNQSGDSSPPKDENESMLVDEDSEGSAGGGIVLKKGPWTSAEDAILVEYVKKHGEGNWNAVQKHSGLFRCGKSCRLRWANHLRPNLKKGAFTPEEEQLIIELHAKMGNKWARMAVQLPGRTDNEIKNYWNTRIKRRQRAGLPLYPPEVSLQALQNSQQSQSSSGVNSRDRDHNDLLQANNFEIPEVYFNSLKANQGVLPYVHQLADISPSSMLMKGLHAPQYCSLMPPTTMHHQNPLRESTVLYHDPDSSVSTPFDQFQGDTCDKVAQQFGSSFLLDRGPVVKNALPLGFIQGSQSLPNGNSSASKPSTGVEKLELPSLQYADTDLGSWDTSVLPPMLESVDAFIQTPPPLTGMFELVCPSPHRNSGLLDALIHEANTRSNVKNIPSDKSSNSSSVTPAYIADSSNLNVGETEWDDYAETISPFGHSATELFNECTPISASGSSFDDPLPPETFSGGNVKIEPVDHAWTPEGEKESKTAATFTRPDALLGSDWFDQTSGFLKDHANGTDAISMLLGDDLASDYRRSSSSFPGWDA